MESNELVQIQDAYDARALLRLLENNSINMFPPQQIKAQLKELLMLKRSGELDTGEKILNSSGEYWRDSIAYECLKRYVCHHDDQIKLNTLALIVESKKSTLKFHSKELDIIILFLRVNLKEKIEFVPLIKKALKRAKDSLAVMQRQHTHEEKMRNHYRKTCSPTEIEQKVLDESYKISCSLERDINIYTDVFHVLRDTCICSPDATYNRRRCSLQILLLMRDLLDKEFKRISWKPEQAEAVFDVMLLDTYEGNKEMALNLIKSLDPNLLQLNDENRVRDIIEVAIELGNSIRPIDTITAAYVLKLCMLAPVVQEVLQNCFDLAKEYKDTKQATVLYLICILLRKLKESLALAKENIAKTVTKHALYGYLFCIRSLLQECSWKDAGKDNLWKETVAELVTACFEFSHAVSSIVNNSSPEGHLPMDLNLRTINEICGAAPDKQVVTPQMVLLCSWRTIKESSLLFGLLATEAPVRDNDSSEGLLNEEQIVGIGEHLVSLLTETKHRGAFEQAHVGFSQLCSRLWHSDKPSLNQLPKMWLHQIFTAITGIKENSKLCATRRSAGVPFMIQALLSTEPRRHRDATTATFDSVMKILLGLTQLGNGNLWERVQLLLYSNSVFSQQENTLLSSKRNDRDAMKKKAQLTEIKTHALNILRAIFRHSQLAEVVNDYVEDGLIAAFRSFDASTWAERNAATLLFSALIIRIFGVQRTKDHINLTADNKMNSRVFFEKYPNLLPFIAEELQTFVAMDQAVMKSNVQSILLLLSRLYHSQNSEPGDIQLKVNELVDLVIQCAKCAIFETRKLAARALVPLLTEQTVGNVLMKVVENILSAENASLNLIHGYMLQMYEIVNKFRFKSFESLDLDWDRFLKKTVWILENLERKNSKPPSFLLAAVYTNVCHELYKADKTYLRQTRAVLSTLISHLLCEELKQGPARELYKLSAIKFIRSIAKETSLVQRWTPVRIYLGNLRVSETRIAVWSSIIEVISEIKYTDVSKLLLDYVVDEIRNSVQQLHKYSPELQDAMFDFLYNCLMYLDRIESFDSTRRINICKFALNDIRRSDNKSYYCERDCYLRLLGKSYATLTLLNKNEEGTNLECANDAYSSFCDNLWIASLHGDFRRSVFEIMSALFLASYEREEYRYVQIQWWTTVLQLLLDNNPEVRHEAFLLIDRVPGHCTAIDNVSYLNMLLSKFHECNVRSKCPELTCIVLFYWSVALQEDTDYEMDDTDVFDKSTNYDFFEPVEVSKTCSEFLMKNTEGCMDGNVPDDAIDWINSLLSIEIKKSVSFRRLVKDYESYVPAIANKLVDILNPTYKSKLLQVLAYREYKKFI